MTHSLPADAPAAAAADRAGSANGVDPVTASRLRLLYLTLPVANVALYLLWFGVGSFLLPLQVARITGTNDTAALSTASTIGAVLATVGNPVFGQLSDRTRSRLGRRAPWILLCAFLGALALTAQAHATSIAMLGLSWGVVQFIMNGYQAALTATLPDRVPPAKYGTFSALVGLGIPLGTMAAALVIGGVPGGRFGLDGVIGGFGGRFAGENGYYLIALAVVAAAAVFVIVSPDRDARALPHERFSFKAFLANFWVSPRKHPDFGWAFLSRLGVMLGYFIVLTYNMFLLAEHIKIPAQDLLPTVGFLMIVNALCTVIASVLAGPIADRVGRVKPFVLTSGIAAALALTLPMLWPTENGMLAYNIAGGLAFGVYMAVDMALITKVLPRSEDAGKDLGVINIANAGPQILAPSIAGWIVAAGGYEALFPIAALFSLIGALGVLRVRGVR
ncbi:MFS transporter [Streptomyces longisporoflavus]|uniref:MFS transporter n=1 Tax=Streptomyces longisporoflavus TaxID=28044 RepID=UPI00167D975E|nr:MFS transporter [Streptomyces longisporoflavus]GGV27144.1 MFS transporter [Streptomyces longisporoflavus]